MLGKSLTCWIKSSYLVTQANLILNRSLTSWIELTSSCESFWPDTEEELDLLDRIYLVLWISLNWSEGRVWLVWWRWIDHILWTSLTWSFGRVWSAWLNRTFLVNQFDLIFWKSLTCWIELILSCRSVDWILGQVNDLPEIGLILWISLTWSCSCRQWHCAIPSKQRGVIFSNFNKFIQE